MLDFFEKYKYVLIIILFLTIVSISYLNYKNTEQVIKDKYDQRRRLVENSIIKSFSYVNDTYRIAEKQLNEEMEEYSYILRDHYRQNPDVFSWDLEGFKEEFEGYDIYIINSNLEVIRSTFKKDIGFDFKEFESFSRIIEARLRGDSFAVDRMDLETNTGKIKKYSYLPTPDNKYLLELSVNVKQKFPVLENLNIFAEARNLAERYESVTEISFYKYSPETENAGKLRTAADPVDTDISDREKEFVKRAYESGVTRRLKGPGNSPYTFTYIPALVAKDDDEASWWNSFVVGITYNHSVVSGEISKNRNLFLVNGLIMVIVFVIFIIIVIYLLKRFEYMAYHDQLTGLPNRKLFVEKTNKMINSTSKSRDKLVIIFIDINNFKEINDNFGHDTGDKILALAANKLKACLREDDCVSRLGGDEFTVAIPNVSSRGEINKIADRIIKIFDEPVEVENSRFFISISLGISIYPEQSNKLEELIKKADYAMYKAKQQQEDFILYNEGI